MVRPAGRRIKAVIAACVGAMIILSVVWNVILYPEYFAPVYFDWNADTGYTRISVTPPGREVGPLTRVMGGMIAAEARPFVDREFRKAGWKSASGLCYVRLLPFPPLVYGVSRLTEPWKIIDPEVTPLMQAAELDRLELIKIELAAGADVNARDQRGWTPLMHACMTRLASSRVVLTLISAGADVNARDKVGRTPLIWAATTGGAEDAVAKVRLLVAAHADPNVKSSFGETALYSAVGAGNAEIVSELLTAGADANARVVEGRTVLSIARAAGDTEMVSLLSRAGARE